MDTSPPSVAAIDAPAIADIPRTIPGFIRIPLAALYWFALLTLALLPVGLYVAGHWCDGAVALAVACLVLSGFMCIHQLKRSIYAAHGVPVEIWDGSGPYATLKAVPLACRCFGFTAAALAYAAIAARVVSLVEIDFVWQRMSMMEDWQAGIAIGRADGLMLGILVESFAFLGVFMIATGWRGDEVGRRLGRRLLVITFVGFILGVVDAPPLIE